MARRFKRRKPRVLWLPTFGLGVSPYADGTEAAHGIEGQLVFDNDAVVYDAFPLTFDAGLDPSDAQSNIPLGITANLADVATGTEYRLRRVVGKIFIAGTSDELDDPPEAPGVIDVAFGFMVCRCDDDGAPITNFDEVNPLMQESSDDPWIWRRRWILNPWNTNLYPIANSQQVNITGNAAYWQYPNTTAGYHSVADGPHIDQKTARVIHRQERLFGIVAARGYYPQGGAQEGAGMRIDYLLDYRLLASLRMNSSGNRRNASR